AQAVNINPDGLGQVLIYPYYTSRGDNQTLLSVVNTTEDAKAVKVRFLEGYNSREVLDFNMYMSAYDVWVAAIVDDGGTPTLLVPDSTCTVPYLFEQDSDGDGIGEQEFLPFAYTGANDDGGPTDISRAAEGHFEMIEMGNVTDDTATAKRLGSAEAATHIVTDDGPRPRDCQQLVDNWTIFGVGPDGMWIQDHTLDIDRGNGGLFGGAAIINVPNGTMYSYDARALQGYDNSDDAHLHFIPGDIQPGLNDGNRTDATIFFGEPLAEAVTLSYPRPVDAVSAVFMKENIMNEYNIQSELNAQSEWVITFPTKNFYVDPAIAPSSPFWIPDVTDPGCNGWDPGEPYPTDARLTGSTTDPDWQQCQFVEQTDFVTEPFTALFNGEACELAFLSVWNREESPVGPPGNIPPIVSPPPPGGSPGGSFTLCYETNVLRFGSGPVPADGTEILASPASTVRNVTLPSDHVNGWANIRFHYNDRNGVPVHRDSVGLIGLPVTGFWAEQFENGFLQGPSGAVLANYGGLFDHKANIRRQVCPDSPGNFTCSRIVFSD
ncbi:MAG: hypothetical protein R3212_03475, partial [Xanthomonadales bacterium]|nr:hypothetical protein [Xanthomonadales bacterium]